MVPGSTAIFGHSTRGCTRMFLMRCMSGARAVLPGSIMVMLDVPWS
jgi:hypothetical protein